MKHIIECTKDEWKFLVEKNYKISKKPLNIPTEDEITEASKLSKSIRSTEFQRGAKWMLKHLNLDE